MFRPSTDTTRLKSIERKVKKITRITVEDINKIENIKEREKAIDILKAIRDHFFTVLVNLGEIEVTEAEFKVK